jgi:hypothetical protein
VTTVAVVGGGATTLSSRKLQAVVNAPNALIASMIVIGLICEASCVVFGQRRTSPVVPDALGRRHAIVPSECADRTSPEVVRASEEEGREELAA